ncbi:microsomal glutathione S-transferase 2 isoform X1 [Hemitrygon akajei]|uniref:microsomal glutathione S-transferase 2 isoform X1 n=1 Tax=Hemitrygon akajei TaxID=2704970 RepID=UPI003BF9B833
MMAGRSLSRCQMQGARSRLTVNYQPCHVGGWGRTFLHLFRLYPLHFAGCDEQRLCLAGCCFTAVCHSAGQNSVEFYPTFLVVLWSSGLFFNQEIASIIGLLYLFSRFIYFNEYAKSAKRRLPAFRIGIAMLLILVCMSTGGIGNSLFDKYFDFNLAKKIKKIIL